MQGISCSCQLKAFNLNHYKRLDSKMKGFFIRSLSKHNQYICFNNRNCCISSDRRKSCKYCRFKQCIAAGMALEAIKLGRKPMTTIKNSFNKTDESIYINSKYFFMLKKILHLFKFS